jgi:hypothetical protein
MVKRIRLLVLLGAVAIALPVGLSSAGATGGHPPANYVTISAYAQYDLVGLQIHVGLTVKCQPTGDNELGVVDVFVTQQYPETPNPLGATGAGFNSVVCDGRSRSVAVSVDPGVFDAGRAYAEATVRAPGVDPDDLGGEVAHAERSITIVHV